MDTGSGSGLPLGAIVGIAVAAFALVVLMAGSSIFIILLYCKLCRHPKKTNQGIYEVHETTNMNCVHTQKYTYMYIHIIHVCMCAPVQGINKLQE